MCRPLGPKWAPPLSLKDTTLSPFSERLTLVEHVPRHRVGFNIIPMPFGCGRATTRTPRIQQKRDETVPGKIE